MKTFFTTVHKLGKFGKNGLWYTMCITHATFIKVLYHLKVSFKQQYERDVKSYKCHLLQIFQPWLAICYKKHAKGVRISQFRTFVNLTMKIQTKPTLKYQTMVLHKCHLQLINARWKTLLLKDAHVIIT